MSDTACLPSGAHSLICRVCTETAPPILADVQVEMDRQHTIHPRRPRHPYEWHTVLGEEVFEALVEVSRLAQDQATGATVDLRLDAARRLRVELIQVAAVAASWAERLP